MSTQKIFKKIYDSTYNKLIKYIACRCNNINDVDDILQETYLAFYKVLLNNKTTLLSPFLFGNTSFTSLFVIIGIIAFLYK